MGSRGVPVAVALCALQASQQGFAQKHPSRDLHALVWPAGTFLHTPAWQPGGLVALGLVTLLLHLAGGNSPRVGLAARETGAVLGGTGSPLGVRTSCSQVMGARAAKPCWWPLLLPTEQLGGWGRSRPQRRAAWCCLYSAVPAAGRQHPLGILTQGRGISGCRKGKESLGRTRTVSSCGSVSGRLHLVARLVLKLLRSWEWSKEHPLHPSCPAGLRPL